MGDNNDSLIDLPQDDHTRLALVIQELRSLGKRVDNLSEICRTFVTVADQKIDIKVYLADKEHTQKFIELLDKRVTTLENEKENEKVRKEAKTEQRDTVFGITKGTWFVIMQIINLLVLFGIVGTIK